MANDEGFGANESGMEKRKRTRKESDYHAEKMCEVTYFFNSFSSNAILILQVCFSVQNVDNMFECYTCKARIHIYCIDPRPLGLPKEDQYWACKDCQDMSGKVGREDKSREFHWKLMKHKQMGKSSVQAESSLRAGMRNSPKTKKRKISVNSRPKEGEEKMKTCTINLGRNEISSAILHKMNLLPKKDATEKENLQSQDVNENVEHHDLSVAQKKLKDELQRFRESQERDLDNFRLKKKSEMARIIADKEKENDEEIKKFAMSMEETFKKYEERCRKELLLAEIAEKKSKLSNEKVELSKEKAELSKEMNEKEREMNEKEREMRELEAQEDSMRNDSIIVID